MFAWYSVACFVSAKVHDVESRNTQHATRALPLLPRFHKWLKIPVFKTRYRQIPRSPLAGVQSFIDGSSFGFARELIREFLIKRVLAALVGAARMCYTRRRKSAIVGPGKYESFGWPDHEHENGRVTRRAADTVARQSLGQRRPWSEAPS